MDTIIRDVSQIDPGTRQVLEHMLGQDLSDGQQVVISVRSGDSPSSNPGRQSLASLNLYQGLSDEQIVELESAILQRDHSTRSIE